jgi:hypothetical protein
MAERGGGGGTNASGFLPFLSMKEEISNSVNGGWFLGDTVPTEGGMGKKKSSNFLYI